jgi:hypothetical protein
MTRPEQVLAEHHTRYFHSSTFVELGDGRILHAADRTFTTSSDGGLTWSKPFEKKDVDGNPVGGGGTSLVRLSGRGIGLAAQRISRTGNLSEDMRSSGVVFWRSDDGGDTWQAPVRMTPPGFFASVYQDVFLRSSSGRILLPVFTLMGQAAGVGDPPAPFVGKLVRNQWVSTSAHFFGPFISAVYVCYSDDGGRTWQRSQGELIILLDWNARITYVAEPSIAETAPGTLIMMMRTCLGRLYQAWSHDNGVTWTRPQPTALAASTTPAQIRKLPSGHLLVVWNQESEDEIRRGWNRTRLSSAVSRDGGSVWEFFQNIESLLPGTRVEPGPIRPVRPAEMYMPPGQPALVREPADIEGAEEHGRWSYPSVLVLRDRVLVAYTYSEYEEDEAQARLMLSSQKPDSFNQKLKVLPLNWFYGGKAPAANPFLREVSAPAKP